MYMVCFWTQLSRRYRDIIYSYINVIYIALLPSSHTIQRCKQFILIQNVTPLIIALRIKARPWGLEQNKESPYPE